MLVQNFPTGLSGGATIVLQTTLARVEVRIFHKVNGEDCLRKKEEFREWLLRWVFSHPKLGPSASMLNRISAPAASFSRLKNFPGPSSIAVSPKTSSPSSSLPLFSGPLRDPSSSHKLFSADFTNATKWRSTRSSAEGASVFPSAAAEAWAEARSGEVSSSLARSGGESGIASVMRWDRGVEGAREQLSIQSYRLSLIAGELTNQIPCHAIAHRMQQSHQAACIPYRLLEPQHLFI